jgi:hypothetical protein
MIKYLIGIAIIAVIIYILVYIEKEIKLKRDTSPAWGFIIGALLVALIPCIGSFSIVIFIIVCGYGIAKALE